MQFRNPGHALRWAYETTNRPIVKTSSVNSMRGPSGHGELNPHDRHAQAALIMALCERVLNSLQLAYVRAQFGRDSCGFDLLTHHLAANFGTGLHSRRALEIIIRGYCGDKVGLRQLQRNMGIGFLKAVCLRNQGYNLFDDLHQQIIDVLWREMVNSNLLVEVA
jgi:hypothetical protein